jgi:hypothetical protein
VLFFASNSLLTRIEYDEFAQSSLQWIVIPCCSRFTEGAPFAGGKLLSKAIERGNERFAIWEDLLIDILNYKLIRDFSSSSSVIIPRDIEILCSGCFSRCESLLSVRIKHPPIKRQIIRQRRKGVRAQLRALPVRRELQTKVHSKQFLHKSPNFTPSPVPFPAGVRDQPQACLRTPVADPSVFGLEHCGNETDKWFRN